MSIKRSFNMEENKEYLLLCDKHKPKSNLIKHTLFAFLFGGGICFLGELLANAFLMLGMTTENAYLSVTLTLIFLSSLFTALGFFDRLATIAGAGTLVPVTGFSNAVTSSAIDTKSEGFIAGVGTKIFTVAGPVILYSSIGGFIYGLIIYLF